MALVFKKKHILLVVSMVTITIVATLALLSSRPLLDWNDISKQGRITVAIEKSYFGLTNDSNGIGGFQYELIKIFADSMQLELVIVEESDLQKSVDMLLNGECDIVASMVPLGAFKDTQNIAYTLPLQSSRLVLVQNAADSTQQVFRKQYELDNDTIHVAQGSRYVQRLKNLSDEIAANIYVFEVKNKSNDELVGLVAQGIYSQSVLLENRAKYFATQYPHLDFSLPLGMQQQQVWMMRKSSPQLLSKFNTFYAEFKVSYAYMQLYAKYFNN